MSKYCIVYNPLSNSGKGVESSHRLDEILSNDELEYVDITSTNYSDIFAKISDDTNVVICGGDGTLNKFINSTSADNYNNEIYYFACGTGNDFLTDIGAEQGTKPVAISKYIRELPTVTVNGQTYRFLNNVGFGIDGYCTLVGDQMREAGKDNINYAGIAIKGMLGAFKPVDATIEVDGTINKFRYTWLAPTMNGRFYGGGMNATPDQNRLNPDHTVSCMLFHGKSKIKTLMVFPSIFQGEHVKHEKQVQVFKGHHIRVTFAKPCPLQIDGETIPNVTEYEVHAYNS